MKERAMRRVSGILPILLLMGMASPALAADYDLPNVPVLRGSAQPPAPVLSVGPATFARWSGFYFGGNVSLGSATSDFSTATRPLVQTGLQHATILDQSDIADFHVLDRGSSVAAGGGAFLGYNTQWQDLVLGVEATYTHKNRESIRPGTPQRSIIGPHPQRVGTRRGPDKDHSGMWRSVKVDGI
jgi:outer membrane immunogenic protein